MPKTQNINSHFDKFVAALPDNNHILPQRINCCFGFLCKKQPLKSIGHLVGEMIDLGWVSWFLGVRLELVGVRVYGDFKNDVKLWFLRVKQFMLNGVSKTSN